MTDQAGEEALGRAHCLKRPVRHGMTGVIGRSPKLVTHESTQVNMLDNELCALDNRIKPRAARREKPRTALRFLLRKRDESRKGRDRDEYRDEVRHGINALKAARSGSRERARRISASLR